MFWTHYILNLVLLQQCNQIIQVFSYFPYENNKCAIFDKSNIYQIGYFNNRNQYKTVHIVEPRKHFSNRFNRLPYFPGKVPRDLNECAIKILASVWPPFVIDPKDKNNAGFEIDFVYNVMEQMNLNVTWIQYENWNKSCELLIV